MDYWSNTSHSFRCTVDFPAGKQRRPFYILFCQPCKYRQVTRCSIKPIYRREVITMPDDEEEEKIDNIAGLPDPDNFF